MTASETVRGSAARIDGAGGPNGGDAANGGGAPNGDRLLSVEEARGRVLDAIDGPLPAVRLPILEALGLVLAEDITAATSLPPWDNSAMDGYAIRSADVAAAAETAPVLLRVIGEIAAGVAPSVAVAPGTAIRIATGAPLPDGADAVIPVELTTPADATGTPAGQRGRDAAGPLPAAVLAHATVDPGGSVRGMGSDVRQGAVVLQRGSTISPSAVALAAGSGTVEVPVHRRPRVGVLATGDEIRASGEDLGPAGIPDANRPALLAQVRTTGGEAVDLGVARDRLEDVLGALRAGVAASVDAVIVSGGVSVGPYDVVKAAFDALGRIELWRVNVQPGKPFAFGAIERRDERPIHLFGLPGNPVSSLVTFDLFVRPALRRLAGHARLLRPLDRAVLGEDVSKSHGRRAFLRVVVERDADGRPIRDARGRLAVRLAGGQGSHVISALAAADALAVIPEADDRLAAGAEVDVWWLDGG